jgi:SAM-dependent methyltransferase
VRGARALRTKVRWMPARSRDDSYASRLEQERRHYDGVATFDDLPPIYHYWSHTFVRPMLEPLGCSNPKEFFARYLRESAARAGASRPTFLSIGSGDANNEVEIARLLESAGLESFTIECIELNRALIERATAAARQAGVERHLIFSEQDFNTWKPQRVYDGIMANQSLHHVTRLESLFDGIREALAPGAYFIASDIIGRNGHQRWPESRRIVEQFWDELPPAYRYHRQLKRHEEQFLDWDCSSEGFEGVRSQDVLPLLIERFAFPVFIGFGSAIDPFVDRGFGPNFNADSGWDRDFIDRVHQRDERGLLARELTPTHMLAVMSLEPSDRPYYARDLTPQDSVRAAGGPAPVFGDADSATPGERSSRLPLRGFVRESGEICGLYEDDWAGTSLEFNVVPERNVRRFVVNLTMPPFTSPSTEVSVDVNGVEVARALCAPRVSVRCERALSEGVPATIRIATTATVNLGKLGAGEDLRDLGLHLDAVTFEG